MTDHMKILARKGILTIAEYPGGKISVKLHQANGNTATLTGRTTKDQLVAELCQIVENWPDKPLCTK